MRKDENGGLCPATLGEYLDFCKALGGPECKAVQFLNKKIESSSRDEEVIAADSQMIALLMPMLVESSR